MADITNADVWFHYICKKSNSHRFFDYIFFILFRIIHKYTNLYNYNGYRVIIVSLQNKIHIEVQFTYPS